MSRNLSSFFVGILLAVAGMALTLLTAGNISRAADAPATGAATAPKSIIRIAAGRSTPYRDFKGNTWEADRGFDGGAMVERPELKITGTEDPGLYFAQRYAVDAYSIKVPNGIYLVKLHFAASQESDSGPDDCVFTFDVQGRKFADFSPWRKAGGHYKACVETIQDVKVTEGAIKITFTPKVGLPAINGIEIHPAEARAIVRVVAGRETPYKDAQGNMWEADKGFEGGSTIERPDVNVAGTTEPGLYRAERYSMESWSWKVPNGTYIVKLHFSEGYEGVSGPDDRVFDFDVQGQKYKNFSPWKGAGGPFKACVHIVNDVKVTEGTIKITFSPIAENPQINALEIYAADSQ